MNKIIFLLVGSLIIIDKHNDIHAAAVKKRTTDQFPLWPEDFRFSIAGKLDDKIYRCVRVNEPNEPFSHFWWDNYLCWKGNKGLEIKWKPDDDVHAIIDVTGMRCTTIFEPKDPVKAWKDNVLCVPPDSPYNFTWSHSGLISGLSCISWNENADPHSWHDNYLCAPPTLNNVNLPDPVFPDDFKWSSGGIPDGYYCIPIIEPLDSKYGYENQLCWKQNTKNPGLMFSHSGVIKHMRCTRTYDDSGHSSWNNNYLCVPKPSNLHIEWSSYRPYNEYTCLQWKGPERDSYWGDKYLCLEKCNLTKIAVIGDPDVRPQYEGTRIIGTASGASCSGTGKSVLSLDNTDTVVETVGIEIADTKEINWHASVNVEVEMSAKFLGSGGSVTVGAEVGAGGSYSYTSAETKSFSESTSTGTGHQTYYTAPGAAFVYALVDKYTVEEYDVPITMQFKCNSGYNFMKNSTMKFESTNFQHLHFESMSNTTSLQACEKGLSNCVKNLAIYKGKLVGNRRKEDIKKELKNLQKSFRGCFNDNNEDDRDESCTCSCEL